MPGPDIDNALCALASTGHTQAATPACPVLLSSATTCMEQRARRTVNPRLTTCCVTATIWPSPEQPTWSRMRSASPCRNSKNCRRCVVYRHTTPHSQAQHEQHNLVNHGAHESNSPGTAHAVLLLRHTNSSLQVDRQTEELVARNRGASSYSNVAAECKAMFQACALNPEPKEAIRKPATVVCKCNALNPKPNKPNKQASDCCLPVRT